MVQVITRRLASDDAHSGLRVFPTATVHVHCVGNLKVIHSRVFLSDKKLNRTQQNQFQVRMALFPCSLSPTILLLLLMRSTLYCHCVEGYTCPSLELVNQYSTDKSRCLQTVTTSINIKVCDMMVDYFILSKIYVPPCSCASLVNHMSPTGQL